jgi:hypothetical protein
MFDDDSDDELNQMPPLPPGGLHAESGHTLSLKRIIDCANDHPGLSRAIERSMAAEQEIWKTRYETEKIRCPTQAMFTVLTFILIGIDWMQLRKTSRRNKLYWKSKRCSTQKSISSILMIDLIPLLGASQGLKNMERLKDEE